MIHFTLFILLLAVYMGNVLGSAVLCETIPELKLAREFVWCIPFLNFFAFFYILLLPKKWEKKFKHLYQYITTPHKNVTATYVVSEIVKQGNTKVFEARNGHKQWGFFKESLSSYGKAIALGLGE